MVKEISGVIVPLLTPLIDGATIDCEAYIKLAGRCAAAGVDAVFLMGTAGEGYNLATAEKIRGVTAVYQRLHEKIRLIVGVLEPSTNHAIAYIRQMESIGIHLFAVVPPYYDEVDQIQIICHYQTIMEAIDPQTKILIYNIPGTTGVDILPATVKELKKNPRIIGIKNSSPRFEELKELIETVSDDRFAVFQGYEDMAIAGLLAGADGIVPCSASLFPEFFVRMVRDAKNHEIARLESMGEIAADLLNMQIYAKYWLASLKASGSILKIVSPVVSYPYEKASPIETEKLRVLVNRLGKEVQTLLH